MDLESIYRWEDYSRAKDEMMVHTDTPTSPWYVVESDIKKHARLNMMAHLLSTIDYDDVELPKVKLPKRVVSVDYHRPAAGAVDLCRRPRGDVDRRRRNCRSADYPSVVRVYVPATLAMLQQLVADGSLRPVSGTAFAVTPTLREAYAEGDDDELADVALREAALASLRLLADDSRDRGPGAAAGGAGGRRPTVPTSTAAARSRRRRGAAGGPVALERVIAAYVDNAAAEPAVLAAVEVVDAADLGDEDAELTVGDAQDHDLAWYAPQELPFLLELL